jgi:hypothetical protein
MFAILFLASVAIPAFCLYRLDATMRLHLWNLLGSAKDNFLASQGTSALGFLSQLAVPSLSGILVALLVLVVRGKKAMKEHVIQTAGIVCCAVICADILWFGSLFSWNVVQAAYEDHTSLVARIEMLHKENATLVDPTARDSRITELEARVEELKKGVGHAPTRTPAPAVEMPVLDPDSFYQFGKVVATVDGAVPDLPSGKITFRVIRPNETLNPDKDVQYREWTLRCIDGGRPLPSARMPAGTAAGRVFPGSAIGWSCSIIGKS